MRIARWSAGCSDPRPPATGPRAAKLLFDTVDAIWHGIGDRSTDYNFYTKRALLAAWSAAPRSNCSRTSPEACAAAGASSNRASADVMRIPQPDRPREELVEKLPDPMRFLRRLRRGNVRRGTHFTPSLAGGGGGGMTRRDLARPPPHADDCVVCVHPSRREGS